MSENLSISDAVTAITAALDPISGKRILDIGCGTGPMARPLMTRGAIWTGVDPYARPGETRAEITLGSAEKLPFADSSFDSAIFVNSLHHVPIGLMEIALSEAARVVRGGPIVVVEPRIDGALSEVLRIIDDETEIRTAAQQALGEAVRGGRFSSVEASDYLRIERFADFDAFLEKMISNNPSRREAAAANREAMRSAFMAHGTPDKTAPDKTEVALDQPMHLHILHLNS